VSKPVVLARYMQFSGKSWNWWYHRVFESMAFPDYFI